MSGVGLPPCGMRTEVTYLERAPYRISSLVSLCIGRDDEAGDAGEAGPWAAVGGDGSNGQAARQRGAALQE